MFDSVPTPGTSILQPVLGWTQSGWSISSWNCCLDGNSSVRALAGSPVLNLSNAVVLLEGGNLASRATNDVLLSLFNKLTFTSTNANKLRLTLSLPTGLLAGKFINPQTLRPSPIKGALLPKQNAGGGFFLGTNQSGALYLGTAEDFPLFTP